MKEEREVSAISIRYPPVGEYFDGLLEAYIDVYKKWDKDGLPAHLLKERNRIQGLMKDEFEKQKKETDLKGVTDNRAFEYTWRGLLMDIDGIATRCWDRLD